MIIRWHRAQLQSRAKSHFSKPTSPRRRNRSASRRIGDRRTRLSRGRLWPRNRKHFRRREAPRPQSRPSESCAGRSPVDLLRFISSEVALRLPEARPRRAFRQSAHRHRASCATTSRGSKSAFKRRVRDRIRSSRKEPSTTWQGIGWASSSRPRKSSGLSSRCRMRTGHSPRSPSDRSGSVKPNARCSQSKTLRREPASSHHVLNARSLRARFLLQNGEPEAALRCVAADPAMSADSVLEGEYLATRALCHSVPRRR